MSISQIQASSVLDLIPVQPAGREPSIDPSRSGTAPQDRGGDFEQTLQETASPRDARESDAGPERSDRGRSDGVEARQPDPSDQAPSDTAQEPDASEPSSDAGGSDDQQAASSDQPDAGQQDSSEESAPRQAELSDDDMPQVSQALAAQLVVASQGVVDSTGSTGEQGQAGDAEAEASAQLAAAVAAAAGQAQSNAAAQATAQQASTTAATAVQPLQQQSTQGDTDQDSSQGKNASTAQANTTASTTAANAASTSASFAVPDQPSGEARLPINATQNTQQPSAALQAQPTGTAAQDDGDALNTARITRGLANAVQQRGGAVTLRLTPPEMGTVRIQMNITGTNVSASFHAETASAQTLLTQQLAQLRTSLEGQGMSVDRLSVQPLASTNAGQNTGQSQNDGNTQQGQQQNAANDGRSRGQFSGGSSNGGSDSGQRDPESANQQTRGFFDQLDDAAEQAAA